jgi:peptidoglycan/LPS O-acetylase OafA/YrhL
MKRNFGLDVLRTLSIWLVLLQHAGVNIPGLQPMQIGSVGVEVFFVLSGFLIGGILFRELGKENSWKSLRTFWVRRWYRILPLYYLMLLIKFFLFRDDVGANIVYYVLFLQNNFYGVQFYDVTWSLVIEEWFYIFAPLFLMTVFAISRNVRWVVSATLAFIFAVNVLRIIYVHLGDVPWSGVNSQFVVRFDSLFLGVLLAYMRSSMANVFAVLSRISVFLFGAVVFIGYVALYRHWAVTDGIDSLLIPRTLGFFILPFSVALMVPFISTKSQMSVQTLRRRMAFEFFQRTSLYTYALYLVHPLVYRLFSLKSNSGVHWWLLFALAIVLSYTCAAILYHLFEKPILNYRDRVTGHSLR